MAKNERLIEVKNLKKIYADKKGGDVIALNDVSFTLPSCGTVFFLGKSGSGKSTLLNLLGGLDGFKEGDILVGGRSMKTFSAKDYDEYRNNYIGFVFQENNLLDKYTVKENIGLALDLKKRKNYDRQIESVLDRVNLTGYANRKANRLSGGQKQRVAIARALIKKPKILLCDEPTGALDSETSDGIFKLLKQISSDTLVIIISHDRDSAEKYGDRIIQIQDGKISADSNILSEEGNCVPSDTIVNSERRGLSAAGTLRIGFGFLVAKPIRLCICAMICLVAFTFLGIADSVGCYNRFIALEQTMESYGTPYFSYAAQDRRYDDVGIDHGTNFMKSFDFDKLQNAVNVKRLDKAYDYHSGRCSSIDFQYEDEYGNYIVNDIYDAFSFGGFAEMDKSLATDYGFKLYGSCPTSYDEVVLTKYSFNGFKKYGYTADDFKKAIFKRQGYLFCICPV